MDGVGGYEGWRWIFIIEGLITIAIAGAAFFLIAPWPEECNFLKLDEKELLLKRLAADRGRIYSHFDRLEDLDRVSISDPVRS